MFEKKDNYGIKWVYKQCWFDLNHIMLPIPTNLHNPFVADLVDNFGSLKDGKKTILQIKKFTQKNNLNNNPTHDQINNVITEITDNKICCNVADIVLEYLITPIQCDIVLQKYCYCSPSIYIVFIISFETIIRRFPFKIVDNGKFEIISNCYYYDYGLLNITSSHLLRTDVELLKQNLGDINLDVTYDELNNMIRALQCIENNNEKTKAILYYDKKIAILVNRDVKSLKIINDQMINTSTDTTTTTTTKTNTNINNDFNLVVSESNKFTVKNIINVPEGTFFSSYAQALTKFCEINMGKYIVIINWAKCCVAQFTKKRLKIFINEYKSERERNFGNIIFDFLHTLSSSI